MASSLQVMNKRLVLLNPVSVSKIIALLEIRAEAHLRGDPRGAGVINNFISIVNL